MNKIVWLIIGIVGLLIVIALIVNVTPTPNESFNEAFDSSKNKGSGYEVTRDSTGLYTVKVDAKIGDFTIYDANNESIYDSRISPMDASGVRAFGEARSHMGGCFRYHIPQEYTFYSNTTPIKMLEFDIAPSGYPDIAERWHPITVNKRETVWTYCGEGGFCEEKLEL